MHTHGYVIVEEPTAQDPIKLPRVAGKTTNLATVANDLFPGEVVVAHELTFLNLSNWQGMPLTWNDGRTIYTEDTTNHQRRWVVEYNGGDYRVIETDPPLISRTQVWGSISASLTIT